ncbi:ESPR-type extended signal peptide-containing protein, partial [Gallibacterium anatis]
MNKIYKVIFNRNKNRYEIVSELASSRGGKCKVKAGKQIAKLFMTGLLATSLSSVASAADEEVKVKYDAATGTIKIVKADESQVLASYAVGGNISSIDPNEGTYPTGTISLGKDSKVLQNNTIAIGTDAHAGNAGASATEYTGKIAIGTKTVTSGDRSIALGNQSTSNNGSYNIAQGNDSIGIGTSTSVFGYSGVSIGRRNIIGIPDPTLVSKDGVLTTKSRTKYSEGDLGGNSVIVGAYNVAYGNRSNVIGTYSRAMGSNSVAIGSGVQSLSDGSIAIGKGSGYEFQEGSRKGGRREKEFYGRDWELPPEYKVLKQVLSTDIAGDKQYKKETGTWENGGTLPKYNNYGAGSSDPGGFIVEGKNALGIGTYTQVRGDSAIGLATGEMTADLSKKDKSQYARDMRKIMDMEETLYDAKEALQAGTGDTETLKSAVKAAEERLEAAKKDFRETYLKKYSFVDGDGALGVGRQILAQGDRSMAVGDYAKAISNDAIAYGGQTLANGTNSMAMGGKAHVGTETDAFANSMAIGSHTNVQAGNAVALGAFSEVTGQNSLALGFGKQSGDAITYNSVSGKDSTLIGSYGTVKGNNSILIGSNGNIANDRVVGLGNNINIKAADQNDQENNTAGSVFLGDHAGYVKDSKRSRSLGQVDVVGSAGKMELTESLSSTKGALRDYTKDFIYIYMLERQDDGTQIGAPIAVRSDFAGGDSTVGVVSVGSTYEQQFNSLKDIQDYHSKVGSLITVPVDVTVQVTKNGVPLGEQQQTRYFAADSTRDTIYADNTLSEEDKAKVWDTIQKSISSSNTTYTVFETRRIQNVAPGLIGLNSTDAINGSQLFATNQMLGNLVGSLKKTLGDSVTVTEDGQITVAGDINTLGWIAKADTVKGSNGTVAYDADKKTGETEEAYQARIAKLEKDGYIVDASKVMTFKAGKNIGLVQKPGEFSISTIDTPSFTSVELRGETKDVDGKNVTEVTKIDSSGMKVVTETSTPASDGSTTPTVTEKVSTTVGKDGVSTDGNIKVTNGTTDLVTIDKGTDNTGTDQEYGKIGLDGKNGSNATITVDRVTSSLDDTKNIGTDPKQDISKNNPAKMDRITYTTKNKDGNDVTHEVATMDDGLFFSGDSADGENNNVKNKFDRKLSQETKIIGGVNLGLTDNASAEDRKKAIAAKLTDGNIGVISDGTDTLTVKLAKQLTGLDSTTYTSPTTKTGDGDATSTMKVDGNGVRFLDNKNQTKTDAPSLTTDGITGGNKTITDVASGIGGEVKDAAHDNANTFLENVNKIGAPTNGISENIVVNAKDLKNLVDTGFKLNTSGQGNAGATTVKIGDTINVVDGANTKVSAITAEDGTHTFHIDVTGMPISYTDNQGNALTKIGDKYYKNTDIENGKPKTNAKDVPADEVTNNIKVIDKDGTTNNQGTISNVKSVFDSNIGNGADTGSNVDEIKDGSVISNTGSNQFINDLTKLNDQVDPKATDAEAEKIRAKKDEEKLNSVSTVRDLQKVALTPLFFEGDVAQDAQTANTFDRKLSEKTKIVGEVKDGLEKEDATAEEKAE